MVMKGNTKKLAKNNRVTAIIPTYNNPEQSMACIVSLIESGFTFHHGKIVVVNNGDGQLQYPNSITLNVNKNIGWERALMVGLSECDTEYVLFMNDDTYIPVSSRAWMIYLTEILDHDQTVGAVGPTSNVVRSWQNIFSNIPHNMIEVEYLIGFCMLIRKSVLDEVGGIDQTLPGGDDLDLSIRIKDAGYKLVIDRKAFVYHHGFGTGVRMYGDHTKENGWNSQEMMDKTNMALIRKHGLYRWWTMMRNIYKGYSDKYYEDIEGQLIKRIVGNGDRRIIELGCGNVRTIPKSVCVDKFNDKVADMMLDVSEKLPFNDGEFDILIGRHILEHLENPKEAFTEWSRVLSKKGKMVLALPYFKWFDVDPTHKVKLELKEIINYFKDTGFTNINSYDSGNYISFVVEGQKA